MQNLNLNIADAQRYINKGKVWYKGKVLQEKTKILSDCVQVLVFKPDSIGLKPLFENEDFAIFNKPPKMLIHPKGRFHHHSFIDEVRAYLGNVANLTHRIDKETSGLVLVGKHKKSIVELGLMFLNNSIKKEYLALTRANNRIQHTKFNCFSLSLPLATQEKGGDLCVRSVYKKSASSHKKLKFKNAQSDFEMLGILDFNDEKLEQLTKYKINGDSEILSKNSKFLLLKVRPKTGRTHQIRVHLQALGIPILGDPLYGAKDKHSREYLDSEFIPKEMESKNTLSDEKRLEYFGATRLMLHAYGLQFHYKGKCYYFKSIENFDINKSIF
ncbi:RluA family pseudouridine synthase [Helicobacter sp. Faydin-H64]|uniref:RNA pseudouridylate synthase n=2 Tax=Helicobacter turcicus TaxID=2867412 RepID=A0ABS7JP67_9HELI|nr:RluA family pseudouridine synthase [Helicobacter turcicus]MBX7546067.1 RluA family pseudouridine synthase [Helicobacter turcicus]